MHQWAKESRVEYWSGSQNIAFPAYRPPLEEEQDKETLTDEKRSALAQKKEPLTEHAKDSLTAAGCQPCPFYFPEGGL